MTFGDRPYEFRCWNTERREMVYGEYPDRYDLDAEHLIWMQWTGIKGAHSEPIFEGDILRNLEYGPELAVVRYDFTEFAAMGGTDHCWNILNTRSEVVGNILQNPELLGDYAPMSSTTL